MKKITLFLLVSFIGGNLLAQNSINKDDFSAKFSLLFEKAKKRFVDEKTGEKTTISESPYVASYGVTTTFTDAVKSRFVVDGDGVLSYDAWFNAGTDKKAASQFRDDVATILKALVPKGFMMRETYEMDYSDPKIYQVEFDSDVFALQAKQPSAKLGIIEREGKFFLRLLIFEPIFK